MKQTQSEEGGPLFISPPCYAGRRAVSLLKTLAGNAGGRRLSHG
jgi:hypothetical protein